MIIPGWRLRTKQDTKRRQPVWVGDVAKAESWGELGQVESYLKAADRYTNSDLVFMCVKRLGDMAADAQLVLYDRNGERDPITGLPTDEARLDFGDHPFYELWNKPNPWDSKAEFLESLIITLLLSPKGVFVHLDDGERPTAGPGGTRRISLEKEPLAMWWLLPEAIKVIPGDDSMIKEYKHTIAGEKTIFEPEAILRLVEFNPINRYHSISRIQPANLSSAADLAGQRANWAMFKNSFRPSAVVEADKDFIDPDELALMEKLWEKRMTGEENWHKLFSLWGGFKLKEWGISPRDAEFTEGARLNRMRIFGVFGVHPGVVLSEDVNLANARVAEHVTRAWTLKPLLRRVSDEITPILDLWPDAPPAEAHFVNVVPDDDQANAEVERIKSEAASQNANAVGNLINALGQAQGIEVAKAWGILPEEVQPDEMADLNLAMRRLYQVAKQGNIVPVLPPVPLEPVQITEADIDRALMEFYGVQPQFTGLLEAQPANGRS